MPCMAVRTDHLGDSIPGDGAQRRVLQLRMAAFFAKLPQVLEKQALRPKAALHRIAGELEPCNRIGCPRGSRIGYYEFDLCNENLEHASK